VNKVHKLSFSPHQKNNLAKNSNIKNKIKIKFYTNLQLEEKKSIFHLKTQQ
jgi:hypothetical protein